MRVATYTQPGAPLRGTLIPMCLLVATILLGSGVVPTIAAFVGGPLSGLMTPLWFLLYLTATLGLMLSHGINWISWLIRYRILLVVLVLGTIMSVFWALDGRVSAERTVHLLGSTLVAIYIGFTIPLLTTLRTFAIVLGLCIVASILSVVAIPELGIENYEGQLVWRGVFNSKNDLGFWAAAGVLLFITLSDSTHTASRKVLCFLMAGLCLAALGLSHSATSLLAMLVAGGLSLYLFIASRFQLGFIRMAAVAIMLAGVVVLIGANIDTAELLGRSGDLTGRGEVWQQTWKLIQQRPLTGFGYGVLWYPTDATIWIQQSLTDFTWVVFHAHNGFLQVASEVGLPLTLIACLMIVQQLIEIFYCQYERQQVGVLFVLSFAIAYLISNYSEARFLISRELFWIFFIALPISMLRQVNVMSAESAVHDRQPHPSDEHGGPRQGGPHSGGPHQGGPGFHNAGPVPGKPWLKPGIGQAPQTGMPAAASAAGLLGHDSHRDDSAEQRTGPDTIAGVAAPSSLQPDALDPLHEDPLASVADSGYEVELDLDLAGEASDSGDVEFDMFANDHQRGLAGAKAPSHTSQELVEPMDLTDADRGLEDSDGEPRATIEHDSLNYNDTLDVDRYDKKFGLTGDWEDLPLDDDS